MPNDVSPSNNLGYVPMNDAPGADLSFDDLFPVEGSEPASQPQVATGTNPPAPPQAPEPPPPFLRAGQTVYLTPEDAIRGTEHKDQLIERYRSFLKHQGFDPNDPQPTPQAQPVPRQEEPSPYAYLNNGKRLYEDLAKAVDAKDPVAYERVMQQYQAEAINAQLAPIQPLIAEVARNRAIRQVSEEIPDFNQFVTSQDFQQVQERAPLLKDAFQRAEANPQAADQLRELMKISYFVNRGLKVNSQAQTTAPPVTTPTVRPTTAPSTMTPPPPGVPTADWATNREARQQLIKDARARGIDNVDWNQVGR